MWLPGVQQHALNSDKVSNYDAVYPAAPGKLFGAPPARKGELSEEELVSRILLPQEVAAPGGARVSGLRYLVGLRESAFNFLVRPALKPEEQMLSAYSSAYQPPPGCAPAADLAAAAAALHARLADVSAAIQAREAALAGRLPQFTLLDPARTPHWSYT